MSRPTNNLHWGWRGGWLILWGTITLLAIIPVLNCNLDLGTKFLVIVCLITVATDWFTDASKLRLEYWKARATKETRI